MTKPLIIFSFAFDPETQKASIAGNISAMEALKILQELAIADAVKRARETKEEVKDEKVEGSPEPA